MDSMAATGVSKVVSAGCRLLCWVSSVLSLSSEMIGSCRSSRPKHLANRGLGRVFLGAGCAREVVMGDHCD